MSDIRKVFSAETASALPERSSVDLEALSQETGLSVEVLSTLAGISDPRNEHMFTAEAARRAFADCATRAAEPPEKV